MRPHHRPLHGLIIIPFILSLSLSTVSHRLDLPAIKLLSSPSVINPHLEEFAERVAENDRGDLEVPEEPEFNQAEIIQNEQRHLKLVNPDVESPGGPTRHAPPFDTMISGESGLRAEFIPVDPEASRADGRDVKLQIQLKFGPHLIPALEYEVPRRWFASRTNPLVTSNKEASATKKLVPTEKGQRENRLVEPEIHSKFNKESEKVVAEAALGSPFGPWSSWTECMGVCGQGMRERERTCRTGTGANCDRDSLRERHLCFLPPCSATDEKMLQPGHYGEWGNWSPCTATCGTSHRTRVRICLKGKCDPELLREKRDCTGLPPCASIDTTNQGQEEATSKICVEPLEFFAHKLNDHAYTSPLSEHPVPAAARWTSKEPFLFPIKHLAKFEPSDLTYLEIKFGHTRMINGWKITGNGEKGSEGLLASYMVKVHDSSLQDWRNIASSNNVPRMFITVSQGDISRCTEVFSEEIPDIFHVDAIRFYPLQWSGQPFLKVDVKGCKDALEQSVVTHTTNHKVLHHIPTTTLKPKSHATTANLTEKRNVLACAQIPLEELTFFETDYGKQVMELKNRPDIEGEGYVNLRLLAHETSLQNHNNHLALEVDLGRERKLEELLFKGALREGMPAILRAFYLQFLDPQAKDWRWLSHAGNPTPFVVTQIPVLSKEQVQTVFPVRFTDSLTTAKFRIFPELWQKLPLIRMGVIACG